jgi:hypothetical protein
MFADYKTGIMKNKLIYVYCISHSPPLLDSNIELGSLLSLKFDDFYAIVKYVSDSEFSEENFKINLSDIKWMETNALDHVRVINMIMKSCTVIPLKFGTFYNNEDELKKFISYYSISLTKNFLNIESKEEWSIKIYCDRKALSERIDELSEAAATLEEQIMSSSPGKAFLLKRKKTELTEKEMDRLCKTYGKDYYNEFNNMSESSTLNNILPKEFTEREDTMILNAAFLVSKLKTSDFKDAIDSFRKNESNSFLFIEATGPWPPYNFVNLQ